MQERLYALFPQCTSGFIFIIRSFHVPLGLRRPVAYQVCNMPRARLTNECVRNALNLGPRPRTSTVQPWWAPVTPTSAREVTSEVTVAVTNRIRIPDKVISLPQYPSIQRLHFLSLNVLNSGPIRDSHLVHFLIIRTSKFF